MNDVLLLYLFTRLDTLLGVFKFVSILSAIGASVTAVGWLEGSGQCRKAVLRIFLPVLIVGTLGYVVMPSQKDAAIIVSGKIALDAARSEKGQEMAGAVYDAIMAKLKEAAKGK